LNNIAEIVKVNETNQSELDVLYGSVISGYDLMDDSPSSRVEENVSYDDSEEYYYEFNTDDVDFLRQELAALMTEVAWLKSENMKSSNMITDYHTKFSKLKTIQKELLDVVDQQSDTIRTLKGYKPDKYKSDDEKEKYNQIASIWMFLPILGLFATAVLELSKYYQIYSVKDFFQFIGIN
jgi:hypothetical protein